MSRSPAVQAPVSDTRRVTDVASWLSTSDGEAAIRAATELPSRDPIAAGAALRAARPDLTPEQAAAALSQAELRRLAHSRYGIDSPLLLTRDGLEQATRPEVAHRRAALIAEAAPERIIDATAGLGFDTAALVATGIPVVAVERDAQTATFLRHNVPSATVLAGDVTELVDELAPSPRDIVFVDPARRDHRRTTDGSRAHPERDPQRWSPPWSFVTSLAERTRVCAKVAPGFAPEALPAGWCGQWTSTERTAVEACLFSWQALPMQRRAVADGDFLDGNGRQPTALNAVRAWLHEPDPAVIAAGLVDDLISEHSDIWRVDERPYWLSSAEPVRSPFLRSFRVLTELPGGVKELRRALVERGIGSVTVKTRGGALNADEIRRRLRLSGSGNQELLVATSVMGRQTSYLVASD